MVDSHFANLLWWLPGAIGLMLLAWLYNVSKRNRSRFNESKPKERVFSQSEYKASLIAWVASGKSVDAFLEEWRGRAVVPDEAPKYTFTNTNTGYYSSGNEVKFAVDGVDQIKWPDAVDRAYTTLGFDESGNLTTFGGFWRDPNHKFQSGMSVKILKTGLIKTLKCYHYPYPSDGLPAWKFTDDTWAYENEFEPF